MPDNSPNSPVLKIAALSVGYSGKAIVSGIDIEAYRGEIVCLLGPNGCGKSTTLRTLTGMIPSVAGDVIIEGREVQDYSPKELSRIMSVVLTEKMSVHLVTAFEIVLMGRLPYISYFGKPSERDKGAAMQALRDVGAGSLATRDFGSLSDGEKQKVMIARALAQEPRLIVLDEPTSHLDMRHKLEVMRILRRLADEKNVAIVMALHDIDIALKMSDKLIMLKGGEVASSGGVEEVLADKRIEDLYGIDEASYSELLGGIEAHNTNPPEVFVLCGGRSGTPVFRMMARLKKGVVAAGAAVGDVDYEVARAMNISLVNISAAEEAKSGICSDFSELGCRIFIDAGGFSGDAASRRALLRSAMDAGALVAIIQSDAESSSDNSGLFREDCEGDEKLLKYCNFVSGVGELPRLLR